MCLCVSLFVSASLSYFLFVLLVLICLNFDFLFDFAFLVLLSLVCLSFLVAFFAILLPIFSVCLILPYFVLFESQSKNLLLGNLTASTPVHERKISTCVEFLHGDGTGSEMWMSSKCISVRD